MFIFKQSTVNWVPISIVDVVTGLGVPGLTHTAITAKVAKTATAAATKTLTAPDWVEAGNGWYWVRLSTSETDTLGVGFLLTFYTSGTTTVEGAYAFEIHANLVSDVQTRLGAPAGASVSADIAAAKTVIDANAVALARSLGLSHDNVVMDQQVYGASGLTSARLRIYNSKANADAGGATGLLYTYLYTASYTGANLTNYKVTRDA